MMKIYRVPIVTVLLVILLVMSGIVGELRYEGLCSLGSWLISAPGSWGAWLRSLGIWSISITCPLGFLERSLAARELLPQFFTSFVLIVASVLLLGRVFCGWVCPAGLVRRVFERNEGVKPVREAASKRVTWGSYYSYAVLGGVLVASYLFRFPVFCLFCPIGLFFGSLYAVIRLFTPDSPGLELVVFPLMLGVELWALGKHWCRSICPLGALLSIIGSLNHFLIPTPTDQECLRSKGINCQMCERACPEGLNLSTIGRSLAPNSCTKCLECYSKCPTGALKISLFR